MQVTARYQLPASAARVAALLADPELVEKAAGGPGMAQATVRHTPDGGFILTLRRPVLAADLPAAWRAMAGNNLEMRQAMVWQAPAADGKRSASLAGEVVGAPVHLEGTLHLDPTDQGCELSIDGQVKASVLLVGPAIEQAGANMVMQVFQDQVTALSEHLDAEA